MTDAAKKTPGQIACEIYAECYNQSYGYNWEDTPEDSRLPWEAAAEAVRAPLLERIAELEARLEIDHVYKMDPANEDGFVRVEIPPEERDNQVDGICARDSTIALLEDRLRELQKRTGVEIR